MKERSESDIIAKSPVEVMLGSVKYPIKPLTLTPARKWRSLLVEAMNDVVQSMAQPEVVGNLGPALTTALIQFPEKLCDLVFAYAPYLDKEKILDETEGATEEQMAEAYAVCMSFAYPLLGHLPKTIAILKANR